MGKKQILIVATAATVLLITLLIMAKRTFTSITENKKLRGTDGWGSGAFGASRSGGSRTHNGIDFIAKPGQAIVSPITGTVKRIAYPYSNDLSYKGLEIVNEEFSVKMFYISPTVAVGSKVNAGQQIATAQNIAAKYGTTMTNHVHFEVRDKTGNLLNPTNMFS